MSTGCSLVGSNLLSDWLLKSVWKVAQLLQGALALHQLPVALLALNPSDASPVRASVEAALGPNFLEGHTHDWQQVQQQPECT